MILPRRPEETSAARRGARRALFALLLLFGILALAEGVLRIAAFERRIPPFVLFHPVGEKVEASLLARPEIVSEETILWRIRPNQTFGLEDRLTYRVNASGFRGPEPTDPKPPGARRVVAIGESVTFGLGVPEEWSFVSRIPEFLGSSAGTVEIANGGVPGYTSYQGRHLLESTALSWEPDAVLFYFGAGNELRAASLTDRERGSQMPSPLLRRLGGLRILQALGTLLARPPAETRTVRVPLSEFEDDLERMVALARGANALPLLVVPPVSPELGKAFPILRYYQSTLRRVSARSRVPLADAAAVFESHSTPSTLFIDLAHLTIEGHGLLAETIASTLGRAGF